MHNDLATYRYYHNLGNFHTDKKVMERDFCVEIFSYYTDGIQHCFVALLFIAG